MSSQPYFPRRLRIAAAGIALGLSGTLTVHAQTNAVEGALGEQAGSQRDAASAQQRIDRLDDQTRIALEQYRETLRQIDQLQTYNTQMERMVATQQAEMESLGREIASIEVTKRQILPFMRQMLDVLGQLVNADTPFLLDERQGRLRELESMMQQAGTSLAEKFRRILEAYQIEMEYGNTIEAYRAELPRASDSRTVELLRIGRTELYYLTLDEQEVGVWDKNQNAWHILPKSNVNFIRQGLRLARKELPPDLIRLPVAAPEKAS